MKDINQFTSEIIEKVNNQKKKKKIRNILISFVASFTVIFLVMYSNIIPITTFDLNKYAYKAYKGVYASEQDNTIFSFANNSTAILSVNDVAYKLDTLNNTKVEFNFNATKIKSANNSTNLLDVDKFNAKTLDEKKQPDNFLDNTKINIIFYDGGATISGNIYGIPVSIDVIIMENTAMESGVWKSFDKDNPPYSSINSYIIVTDNGESYYIQDKSNSYELLFISVYGKKYVVLLDNYGAPSEFVNIVKIDESLYGFSAIKFISESQNNDIYFRLMEKNETLDFQGVELNAKYINAKKRVENLGYNDMAKYLPIKWRLSAEQGHNTKLTNYSAKLNMQNNGFATLTVYEGNNTLTYQGKWISTDMNLVVILDNHSIFGKMFVVYNQNQTKTFEQTAKSNITIRDGFKTGYHDFNYYLTTTYYTLFWGSEYNENTANNSISYESEYTLYGYYYKWYYDRNLPFSYDIAVLPENGKIKMVIHENGTVDFIYEDKVKTINYTKKQTEGSETINIVLENQLNLKRDDKNYIKIKSFSIEDGALRVNYITLIDNGLGPIPNHYIIFDR